MSILSIILIGLIILIATSPTRSTSKETPKSEKPKFSANAQAVIDCLLMQDATARDVAGITGLERRQVEGIFTSCLQRKGYGVRIPVENSKPLLHLTDEFIKNYK